jgi:hypothetical protein
MSWTPVIWIKRKDFERIRSRLDALERCDAWEFDLPNAVGVILSGGELSSSHREIHDIIETEKVDHWILDGEGEGCDRCHVWGEMIMEAYPR